MNSIVRTVMISEACSILDKRVENLYCFDIKCLLLYYMLWMIFDIKTHQCNGQWPRELDKNKDYDLSAKSLSMEEIVGLQHFFNR